MQVKDGVGFACSRRNNQVIQDWYDRLPVHKASGGVAKGTICAALVVLDSLKNDFILDINSHLAAGGARTEAAPVISKKC